ncbi:hypothetical protein GPU89_13700 [Burkholderia cepacia]|nr:hypothetical protein [Burkholderia cepacia]
MRSIMRSARIALYKSKKLRIARVIALFAGTASTASPVAPLRAGGKRDRATVNGHLRIESGIGKFRLVPEGISPPVQRRSIETASACFGESGKSHGIQCGFIAPDKSPA